MKSSIVNGENRGSVINILLKALQSGDKYGYEINKEIETKSNGKYFLKEASLYSGLKRLEASGHITSYWKEGELGIKRHYYSITNLGLEKLRSSNFSWDGNKEFIDEIFKKQDFTQKSSSPNAISPLLRENNTQDAPQSELKKNPFQIEVNPLQQNIFDALLNADNNNTNNETNAEKISQNIENSEIKSFEDLKQEIPIKNQLNETPNKEQNNEKDIELDEKSTNIEPKNSTYQELIKTYSSNSFSNYIANEKEKIDLSLLDRNKENDKNIIYEERNIDKPILEPKEPKIEEIEKVEQAKDSLLSQPSLPLQNDQKLNEKDEEKLDIKNIFGDLLVENDSEKKPPIENEEAKAIEIENEVVKTKKELPRINIDNDVNIMFNASSHPLSQSKTYGQNETIQNKIMSNSSSPTSVKQYIDNVHKKTLISRATTIDEEINLEGINIREYSKMNNKIIKNPNYIYINKVNFALYLTLFLIICLECSLSFVIFKNNENLKVFDIILFSLIMLIFALILYLKIKEYNKDKYKLELKKFNFSNLCFYCSLLGVVCLILFICIDIFEGMTTSNFNIFGEKIFMQALLSLNFVIYPFAKLLICNIKKFSS